MSDVLKDDEPDAKELEVLPPAHDDPKDPHADEDEWTPLPITEDSDGDQ